MFQASSKQQDEPLNEIHATHVGYVWINNSRRHVFQMKDGDMTNTDVFSPNPSALILKPTVISGIGRPSSGKMSLPRFRPLGRILIT